MFTVYWSFEKKTCAVTGKVVRTRIARRQYKACYIIQCAVRRKRENTTTTNFQPRLKPFPFLSIKFNAKQISRKTVSSFPIANRTHTFPSRSDIRTGQSKREDDARFRVTDSAHVAMGRWGKYITRIAMACFQMFSMWPFSQRMKV